MTVWGIVSDVHGNIRALLHAVQACRERGATSFICLGDVIGRGDPVACVEWVRDHATLALIGNRDLDYIGRLPEPLQETVRLWPRLAQADGFIATHGDPRLHPTLNSGAERDGFRGATAYLVEHGARIWFYGHTHRARAWHTRDSGAAMPINADSINTDSMEIDEGTYLVVNVGTTGLPLPGRGSAACAVYDSEAARVVRIDLGGSRKATRSTAGRVRMSAGTTSGSDSGD